MIIGTALYLALLIRFLGRHRWWVTLAIAAAPRRFNWLVFVHWLRVPPVGCSDEAILWTF